MDALFAKAVEAAENGRDDVDERDVNSAVNRAYYAMFNATRAYLRSIGRPHDTSHGTVVQQFGLYLVKTGKVPAEYGRAFNKAMEARAVADYDVIDVPLPDAESFVAMAERLVDIVATLLPPGSVPDGWSRRSTRNQRATRTLAAAFCGIAKAKGETLPNGFEESLVLYGSPEALAALIEHVEDMNDLSSYVRSHVPTFAL